MEFEFDVHDEEGLWGRVRARGPTEEDAKRVAREQLRREVEPGGSLKSRFRLTRVATGRGAS